MIKMQIPIDIIVAVLFLLVFGGFLYILCTFLFRLFEEADIESRTRKIWVWRASIFLIIAYIFAVLWLNREFINAKYLGNSVFFLYITMIIFFISLIEIVVIDLLLPDIIKMWKRIGIEMGVFFLLCFVAVIIIKIYSVLSA